MNTNKLLKYALIFSASIGIILLFRVIPHPPNFTPVIALSFYIPVLLGFWSIPFIILSFAITDYLIGFHSLLIWTWSSLAFIGILSKFSNGIKHSIPGIDIFIDPLFIDISCSILSTLASRLMKISLFFKIWLDFSNLITFLKTILQKIIR